MAEKEKLKKVGDILLNNAMYIIIAVAVVYIAIMRPTFIKLPSIVNILSLTAAKLPIALGIGGCIVLTGTDISAGRVVGLTACISASLLTTVFKVFPGMTSAAPLPLVLLLVIGVGALVGFVNGFSVAKFKLHPFIVTLSTQLIVYGVILMYLMRGVNNGQTLSGLADNYRSFVTGTLFTIGGVAVPKYVLYSLILTIIMWIIWNKTTFWKKYVCGWIKRGGGERVWCQCYAHNYYGVYARWNDVWHYWISGWCAYRFCKCKHGS